MKPRFIKNKTVLIDGLLIFLNGFIIFLITYSTIDEYFGDFPYWGYPQWPWFYENKEIYLYYNISILMVGVLAYEYGLIRLYYKQPYYRHFINVPIYYGLLMMFVNF